MPNEQALIRKSFIKAFPHTEIEHVIFFIVTRSQYKAIVFQDFFQNKSRIRNFQTARFKPAQAKLFKYRQIRRRARCGPVVVLRTVIGTCIHQIPRTRRVANFFPSFVYGHIIMVLKAKHMAKLMAKSPYAVQCIRSLAIHVGLAINFRGTGITVHGHVTGKALLDIIGMRPNRRLHIRICRTHSSINHVDKIYNSVVIAIIRRKIKVFGNKLVHRFAHGINRARSHIARINKRSIRITVPLKRYRASNIKGRAVLSVRVCDKEISNAPAHVVIGITFLIQVVQVFFVGVVPLELDIAKLH